MLAKKGKYHELYLYLSVEISGGAIRQRVLRKVRGKSWNKKREWMLFLLYTRQDHWCHATFYASWIFAPAWKQEYSRRSTLARARSGITMRAVDNGYAPVLPVCFWLMSFSGQWALSHPPVATNACRYTDVAKITMCLLRWCEFWSVDGRLVNEEWRKSVLACQYRM